MKQEIKVKRKSGLHRLRVPVQIWKEGKGEVKRYQEIAGSSVLLEVSEDANINAIVERIKQAVESVQK